MKKEIGKISCATIIGCMEIQNDRITSKQFKTKMIEWHIIDEWGMRGIMSLEKWSWERYCQTYNIYIYR
jgi:hypothetical protein